MDIMQLYMNKPIIFKSSECVKFEPICVNCGQPTMHTFSFKPKGAILISLFTSYSIILNYFLFFRKGLVQIPFCFKCHRDHFLPAKGSIIKVLIVLVLLALFFYLMMCEYYIFAAVSIAIALIILFFMLRKDQRRSSYTLPFRVWMDSGEFFYQFNYGYYYDQLKSSSEENSLKPI
jgi:hypothetical protein